MKNVQTITVTLEGDEWSVILDNVFKRKNAKVTIPGFRKGHAPKNVFIKKYGIESLYDDAINLAIPRAFLKIFENEKLIPACEPKVDLKTIDEEHAEFEFTIITKPEIKLGDYKKLGIKKEKAKVTKEEIAKEIEHMRSHLAEIVVKDEEDDKVEKGDTAVIDFEGSVDGEVFDGGTGTDYPLEIGSNTFIPGFEDALIGAKKGEVRDVKVTFPDDYVADLKGKKATFKVTIKEIKARILPEMNEEFFEDLGYDDVKTQEELEKKVEEHLLTHKIEDVEDKYIEDLLSAGIEKMTVEVNDEIVAEEVERMIKDLSNRLEEHGLPLESYLEFNGSSLEDFKEKSKPEALKRIKTRYLIDEIIEREKLEATDDEVQAHAKEQAEKYGLDTNELINMYGGIDTVKYDLLIHKAIDVLKG